MAPHALQAMGDSSRLGPGYPHSVDLQAFRRITPGS